MIFYKLTKFTLISYILLLSHHSLSASFYMQSLVYDNRSFKMTSDNIKGIVNITTTDGPGSVYYKIFSSQCNGSSLPYRQSYYVVPNNIIINALPADVKWTAQQQIIPVDTNNTLLMGILVQSTVSCNPIGSGISGGGSGQASGLITVPQTLPPGTYKSPGFTYYFGEILGDTPSSFISTILSNYKLGDKITVAEGNYDNIIIPLSCTTNQNQIDIDFGDMNINTSKLSTPYQVDLKCNSPDAARNININIIPENSATSNVNGDELDISPSKGVNIFLNASKSLSGNNNATILLFSRIIVDNTAAAGYTKTSAILRLQFP